MPTRTVQEDTRISTLLADDSEVFLRFALPYLEAAAELLVMEAVHDGAEALQAVRRLRPRLLLLDLQMPGMDGLAVVRQLRREGSDTRIVILTLHDTPRLRAACLDAGASAFIGKQNLHAELPGLLRLLFPGSAASEAEPKPARTGA